VPDWLSGFGQAEEQPAAGEAAQPTAAGETPDWLAGFGQPAADEPAQPAAAAGEVPDWLSGFGQAEEQPAAEEAAQPAAAGETPDWLAAFGQPAAEEPAQPAAAGETPDWLTGLGQPAAEEPAQPGAAEETPDWLAGIGAGQSLGAFTPTEFEDKSGPPPLAAEEAPDWLQQFGAEQPQEPATSGAPAFAQDEGSVSPFAGPGEGGESPDWLAELQPEEAQAEPAAPAETPAEGDSLAPAMLPTWLEAMRPVESAAPGAGALLDKDAPVESAGPLAGLRGVLPAEPEAARVGLKPPVYSNKLDVSEAQQARISLLEGLIAGENQAQPIPAAPVLSVQHMLRIAIALMLMLAVLGAAVLSAGLNKGIVAEPEPGAVPAEVEALQSEINALPSNVPVLVAVDYEPALAGEMEFTAAAVIQHLMSKNAYLTLVSTTPLGPVMGERLIDRVDGLDVAATNTYTNLGYVSGGPAGLLGFASNPQQVTPYTLRDVYRAQTVWERAPLAGVKQIADFALVVVITDKTDVARAWIEQVQPLLGGKPLLMVVSAQVGPLVYPYYPTQVRGLVAGAAGGIAYQVQTQMAGLTYKTLVGDTRWTPVIWDGMSAGLLVAVLLIVVGATINAIRGAAVNAPKTSGSATKPAAPATKGSKPAKEAKPAKGAQPAKGKPAKGKPEQKANAGKKVAK
jgi:hypothetical protein